MGKYHVELTEEFDKHLAHWKKVGNTAIIKKIGKMMLELENHPTTGIGKPELLKGDLAGLWSRRLNQQHRMIYEIDDGIVTVYVLSGKGHYDNK
ncbi:MAG: addiction module toxin YoeB [Pelodictyon luteolum]|uniref:Putative mRNA interferase YoeB n=2 Tax=Pelodictyon luteolum TaxID=1100 RepID=Q3B1K9_CHLL3|nr:Txe/YoeB family addiction module toxin [Pelodictyon luteolum]ABB24772.1 Addiction module toxin, Txe/YoeB [Pelodictyon luteolum DSM 273]KZK74610.1 MAG: addiction module toxin YoeB [Pelodictyon luteolum]